MTCPFCGANLPDNSDFCDACGTPIASWQSQSNNSTNLSDALFNSAPTSGYSSGYSSSYSRTKSSSNSMIKFVCILVICAIAFIILYNLLGFKYMGTYELDSVEVNGFEISVDLFEQTAGQSVDMSIKILPLGKAKIDLEGLGQSVKGYSKVKITGETLKISNPDTGFTISGKYDKNSKTITLDFPVAELATPEELAALGDIPGVEDIVFSMNFKKK